MSKRIFLLLGALFLTSCAKLAHIDELLTLQDLSIEQDKQIKFVEAQDKKFGLLLSAIENNALDRYPDQKSFLKDFGPPVYVKKITRGNQQLEKWVYRYSTKAFGSEKVYAYFDQSGKLVEWDHIKPLKKDD